LHFSLFIFHFSFFTLHFFYQDPVSFQMDTMSPSDPLFNFVALDLETTGLNPEKDRIIEVGAVRVREGRVVDELSQLVDPQIPLPRFITDLTGISQEDLGGQPVIDQVLPRVLDFLGEDPLVAHNAAFDVNFLGAALKRAALPSLSNTNFDTLFLSCIFLPCLRDHRLATLVDFYQISLKRAHRALDDARATGELFLSLVRQMVALDLTTLGLLSRLAAGLGSGLETIFSQGLRLTVKEVLTRKIPAGGERQDLLGDFFNLSGEPVAESPGKGEEGARRPLDPSAMEVLLGPQTGLGRALGQFEQRPQQVRMVQAVTRAFNSSEFLAVEAGTGTGKSLAYLIPAVHWAVQNGERVIISTNTKNLQEQLFFKDIPLLHDALELSFSAALVKGRSNYLCLNKWNWALSQSGQVLTVHERRQLLSLVVWAQQTQTGDVAENTGFFAEPGVWSKVCAERNYCLGSRCKFNGRCFVMRIRRAAAHAHLVVVNHSLFFSDLASEGAVLSNYDHVIFDEAHCLEKVACQYLGVELNWWMLRTLLNRIYQREVLELGVLPTLRRRVEHAAISDAAREPFLGRIDRAIQDRDDLWQVGTDFFKFLTETVLVLYGEREGGYTGKYRYRRDGELVGQIKSQADEFAGDLIGLKASLLDLVGMLDGLEPESLKDQEQQREDLAARARDCQEIIDALGHLVGAEDEQYVYWVQTPTREDSFDTRLFSAPLHVAQLMRTLVYNRLRTAIHTSATLSVAGQFDYFLSRIGLHLVEPERLRTLSLGSPFDFDEQALVCLPSYLPSPKDARFLGEAIEVLYQALLASRGGALVLFTSYEMLDRAYGELKESLGQQGILVLGQGKDGSRTNILNRFRQEHESVLMGTNSFWEGVDIPGESLRSLVLTKLPFLVPTEPLVEAHMEELEKQGRNSFTEYVLPEAVIRFRQGFGRLIRRRDDRGVVLILDRRVLSTRYGSTFLRSLPTRTWALDSPQALVEDIRRWLEVEKKPPSAAQAK
jgi:predicted DnaQ family exonuclease/DinG family helicase